MNWLDFHVYLTPRIFDSNWNMHGFIRANVKFSLVSWLSFFHSALLHLIWSEKRGGGLSRETKLAENCYANSRKAFLPHTPVPFQRTPNDRLFFENRKRHY